jgi:hypothetical protein
VSRRPADRAISDEQRRAGDLPGDGRGRPAMPAGREPGVTGTTRPADPGRPDLLGSDPALPDNLNRLGRPAGTALPDLGRPDPVGPAAGTAPRSDLAGPGGTGSASAAPEPGRPQTTRSDLGSPPPAQPETGRPYLAGPDRPGPTSSGPTSSGLGTSGSGTSGLGTSGSGISGSGTSRPGTSGPGTSRSGTGGAADGRRDAARAGINGPTPDPASGHPTPGTGVPSASPAGHAGIEATGAAQTGDVPDVAEGDRPRLTRRVPLANLAEGLRRPDESTGSEPQLIRDPEQAREALSRFQASQRAARAMLDGIDDRHHESGGDSHS